MHVIKQIKVVDWQSVIQINVIAFSGFELWKQNRLAVQSAIQQGLIVESK